MFIVGNVLIAIAMVLKVVLWFAKWLIIIRALISWVNPDPFNPIVIFLTRTTDPILIPIRRNLPLYSGIDFSPIVAFLIIIFIEMAVLNSLIALGASMGGRMFGF